MEKKTEKNHHPEYPRIKKNTSKKSRIIGTERQFRKEKLLKQKIISLIPKWRELC